MARNSVELKTSQDSGELIGLALRELCLRAQSLQRLTLRQWFGTGLLPTAGVLVLHVLSYAFGPRFRRPLTAPDLGLFVIALARKLYLDPLSGVPFVVRLAPQQVHCRAQAMKPRR